MRPRKITESNRHALAAILSAALCSPARLCATGCQQGTPPAVKVSHLSGSTFTTVHTAALFLA